MLLLCIALIAQRIVHWMCRNSTGLECLLFFLNSKYAIFSSYCATWFYFGQTQRLLHRCVMSANLKIVISYIIFTIFHAHRRVYSCFSYGMVWVSYWFGANNGFLNRSVFLFLFPRETKWLKHETILKNSLFFCLYRCVPSQTKINRQLIYLDDSVMSRLPRPNTKTKILYTCSVYTSVFNGIIYIYMSPIRNVFMCIQCWVFHSTLLWFI